MDRTAEAISISLHIFQLIPGQLFHCSLVGGVGAGIHISTLGILTGIHAYIKISLRFSIHRINYIEMIRIGFIILGILRCIQLKLRYPVWQVQIYLLLIRNTNTIGFPVLHFNAPVIHENSFFSCSQLHKLILDFQGISLFNIPVPDIGIYHKPDGQCILIPVQYQIIILIHFFKLIKTIAVSIGGKHVLNAKDIIHQLGNAVIPVFIGPRFNSEAVTKFRD